MRRASVILGLVSWLLASCGREEEVRRDGAAAATGRRRVAAMEAKLGGGIAGMGDRPRPNFEGADENTVDFYPVGGLELGAFPVRLWQALREEEAGVVWPRYLALIERVKEEEAGISEDGMKIVRPGRLTLRATLFDTTTETALVTAQAGGVHAVGESLYSTVFRGGLTRRVEKATPRQRAALLLETKVAERLEAALEEAWR